jgi:hypothetical protein
LIDQDALFCRCYYHHAKLRDAQEQVTSMLTVTAPDKLLMGNVKIIANKVSQDDACANT